MEHWETRTGREQIYKGKVFNVYHDTVTLQNGASATRDFVEHHGGVTVLAFPRPNILLMVEQYRYGSQQVMLELPAGCLEIDENPTEAARRELSEETGYHAETLELLVETFPTPAYDSEKLSIFLAGGLTLGPQHLDADEFLNICEMPFREALQLCLNGSITDAKTQVGILTYALRQKVGIV